MFFNMVPYRFFKNSMKSSSVFHLTEIYRYLQKEKKKIFNVYFFPNFLTASDMFISPELKKNIFFKFNQQPKGAREGRYSDMKIEAAY